GLPGHRRPHPPDRRPRRLQLHPLSTAARPARHRRRQRLQRTLLRRTTDPDHRRTIHTPLLRRLPLSRLLSQHLHEHLVLLRRRQPPTPDTPRRPRRPRHPPPSPRRPPPPPLPPPPP